MTAKKRTIIAVGGGTGLPLMLRSILELGHEPTAIVTMADDGGSSGRLRRELGIVPPGDVRNCLAALASPDNELLARLLSYRFSEGEGITGHAVGNLILAALTDMSGSFQQAIEYLEQRLATCGHVLPSTYANVTLAGYDRQGTEIDGQESLAGNPVAIADVQLTPADAPANPQAIAALTQADLVLICPGSLYTSIIPNFLVPDILRALCGTKAPIVYFCNVANMRGETSGFTPIDYVEALEDHGLRGCLDMVVLPEAVGDAVEKSRAMSATPEIVEELRAHNLEVLSAPLTSPANPFRHDQEALTAVLEQVIEDVFYG